MRLEARERCSCSSNYRLIAFHTADLQSVYKGKETVLGRTWHGGATVGRWTCDHEVVGSIPGSGRSCVTTVDKSLTPACLDADSLRYYMESLNRVPLPLRGRTRTVVYDQNPAWE